MIYWAWMDWLLAREFFFVRWFGCYPRAQQSNVTGAALTPSLLKMIPLKLFNAPILYGPASFAPLPTKINYFRPALIFRRVASEAVSNARSRIIDLKHVTKPTLLLSIPLKNKCRLLSSGYVQVSANSLSLNWTVVIR